MSYSFRPMDEASARAMLSWHYEPPYSLYNVEPEYVDAALPGVLDPAWAYFSMHDENDELIGFCCFGEDARVPGGDYRTPALDIGWGMRPDLTGKGRGQEFVRTILDFGHHTFAPALFRTTVAAFNARSRRVCERAGFRPVQEFAQSETGERFVILARPV